MGRYLRKFREAFLKGDLILLLICLVTSAFGCICITSATNPMGYSRYLSVQIVAILLGVVFYMMTSSLDVDFLSEHRSVLVGFSAFLLLLYRLSTTTTLCPALSSSTQVWEPMNPAPPVVRMFMG